MEQPRFVQPERAVQSNRLIDAAPFVGSQLIAERHIEPPVKRRVLKPGESVQGDDARGPLGNEAKRDADVVARPDLEYPRAVQSLWRQARVLRVVLERVIDGIQRRRDVGVVASRSVGIADLTRDDPASPQEILIGVGGDDAPLESVDEGLPQRGSTPPR